MAKKIVNVAVWVAGLILPTQIFGAMSSTNYFIYADSVGWGGGGSSTSSNYNLSGSVGESPLGVSASGTYEMRAGYQAMERGTLSLAFTVADLNFGGLDSSVVKSVSTVAEVNTDALTGYSLSISSVSGNVPYTVSDGAVTAGQNEYGLSASGADAQIAGDVAVAGGVLVASKNGPAFNAPTIVTFKGSVEAGVAGGSYRQSVVFIASANF